MALVVLGLNHQTAPIALREQVAFAPASLPDALRSLMDVDGVQEAALLSTCNRTEIYASVSDDAEPDARGRAEQRLQAWLATHHALGEDALQTHLYRHHDAQAARHLFRVATGLDSLVLGEPQILGQVKDAWQVARTAGALKTPLDRLFQHGFSVAKRIRTDTSIGAHPVSVAFAAVRLAQQVFARLDQATVMLIGAGDTIELAARHLVDAKAKRLLVANRTLEHAQTLASRFGGYALSLADVNAHLAEADIVISATASPEPVLRFPMVRNAMALRRHRPMFLLDLAVPRDIESSVTMLEDAYLYTVDDLEKVIEGNRRSRREAADQAEAIIDLQVDHYMAWWQASGRQDGLKRLRANGEAMRDEVLARAREQLAAGREPQAVLDYLANTLTNKLLHAPSAALKQAALRGDADLLQAAQTLFAIAVPPAAPPDALQPRPLPDVDDPQSPPQA